MLEAKQYFNLSFSIYKNVSRGDYRRGGVVMFMKDWLAEAIMNVDKSTEDQIWVTMSLVSGPEAWRGLYTSGRLAILLAGTARSTGPTRYRV
ncbi:hypothetical protein E2C01_053132 [Portunus trituberculatus]|uniref:Uncharacterized protein n=1 Tax=Portunus trituberculatus TaxID=210409 RepID=A0A5B7GPI0_PORTR|nr:hypothetical protein [Portunus trituberculatus]